MPGDWLLDNGVASSRLGWAAESLFSASVAASLKSHLVIGHMMTWWKGEQDAAKQ
jgi:hypothetical protein